MALTLKINSPGYGYDVAKVFSVNEALLKEAKSYGVTITTDSPGSFTVAYNGTKTGTVLIKGTTVTSAKQGLLGPGSKATYTNNFEDALKMAIGLAKKAMASPVPVEDDDADNEDEDDPKSLKFPGSAPKTLGALLQEKMKASTAPANATPVPLAMASALMQPVKGTSAGSVYYTLALFKGMNLAARIQDSELSVRAEGISLGTYAPILKDLTFDMGGNGQYMSTHFTMKKENKAMIRKTLGAIIGSIGFDNAKQMCDIGKFVKEHP